MAFREVRVFEIREVLRLWLRDEGIRSIERLGGVDRKTVRRYVAAAHATPNPTRVASSAAGEARSLKIIRRGLAKPAPLRQRAGDRRPLPLVRIARYRGGLTGRQVAGSRVREFRI